MATLSLAVPSPAPDTAEVPVKRRKVTSEIEGKYVINMPKGTTPRTKKILEEQAAKSEFIKASSSNCLLNELFCFEGYFVIVVIVFFIYIKYIYIYGNFL